MTETCMLDIMTTALVLDGSLEGSRSRPSDPISSRREYLPEKAGRGVMNSECGLPCIYLRVHPGTYRLEISSLNSDLEVTISISRDGAVPLASHGPSLRAHSNPKAANASALSPVSESLTRLPRALPADWSLEAEAPEATR